MASSRVTQDTSDLSTRLWLEKANYERFLSRVKVMGQTHSAKDLRTANALNLEPSKKDGSQASDRRSKEMTALEVRAARLVERQDSTGVRVRTIDLRAMHMFGSSGRY